MGGTILIIDDEEEICAVLTEFLEQKGYTVFQAHDVPQARSHLRSGLHPDLVILDVVLKGGDGISFLREIRTSVAPRDVPVIMVSAHRTAASDRVSGLETGADDYMSKPFDLRELNLRIERLLRPQRSTTKDRTAGKPLPAPEDMATILKSLLEKPPATPPSARSVESPTLPTPEAEITPALAGVLREDAADIAGDPDLSSASVGPGAVKEFITDFFTLILEPRRFFSNARERPSSRIGYLSVALTALGVGIQEGFETKTVAAAFINTMMYSALYFGAVAVAAWLVQWIRGLLRKPVAFRDTFAALCLGFAPMVVSGILASIYVAVGHGRTGDFTVGPLLAFPAEGASKHLGFLLRHIDVFELWSVWIAGVAVAPVTGVKRTTVIRWAFVAWAIIIGGGTALFGIFA